MYGARSGTTFDGGEMDKKERGPRKLKGPVRDIDWLYKIERFPALRTPAPPEGRTRANRPTGVNYEVP